MKWKQTVAAIARIATIRYRPVWVYRKPAAQAIGSVHIAHSCDHNPYPIHRYAAGSYPIARKFWSLKRKGEHAAATAAWVREHPKIRAAA
jgi:hypothetical protein